MAVCKKCGNEVEKGEKCTCEAKPKFCTECGKKIENGVECTCQTVAQSAPAQFDFMTTLVKIKDNLLMSIKKPVTVVEENVKENNIPKAYITLAILALTFGLFISSLIKNLMVLLLQSMGGLYAMAMTSDVMDAIKIPYLKITLYGMISFGLMIAVYACVMLLISKIFKTKEIKFLEGLNLATSAHLPMIFVNLICAILGFIGIKLVIVLGLFMVGNLIVTYNFSLAYSKITKVEDNKFGYVIAVLVVITSLVLGVISYTIAKNSTSELTNDMANTTDLYDLFN